MMERAHIVDQVGRSVALATLKEGCSAHSRVKRSYYYFNNNTITIDNRYNSFIEHVKITKSIYVLQLIYPQLQGQIKDKQVDWSFKYEIIKRLYHDNNRLYSTGFKSSILNLNHFLEDGLLRVGGRLHLSSFMYDKRHLVGKRSLFY